MFIELQCMAPRTWVHLQDLKVLKCITYMYLMVIHVEYNNIATCILYILQVIIVMYIFCEKGGGLWQLEIWTTDKLLVHGELLRGSCCLLLHSETCAGIFWHQLDKQPPNIFMQEILLVQVSNFGYLFIPLFQSDLTRLNVHCAPLGFFDIDLREHPQAQLAGLDDIPERFVGSR